MPVTQDEIEKELVKLNPNKSCGFEVLQLKVIGRVAHPRKHPLKIIYNKINLFQQA